MAQPVHIAPIVSNLCLHNSNVGDSEIEALLKIGDQQAISMLYQAYAPALYGIISQLILSKPTAEEILQETFIYVWRNAVAYDHRQGRLFTWLVQIARDNTRQKLCATELDKNDLQVWRNSNDALSKS